MSDRRVDDVIREVARHFVAIATPDELAAFLPCGCGHCVFAEAVEHARWMRANAAARTTTRERAVVPKETKR